MKILLVEDDYLAAKDLIDDLFRAFPGLRQEDILHISTEEEFRLKLNSIVKSPPKAAVFDIMLRWTDPKEELQEPPTDVRINGPWRAGLRCAVLFQQRLPKIPIFLYTVLDADDLVGEVPPNLDFDLLSKSPTSVALVEKLRQLGLK